MRSRGPPRRRGRDRRAPGLRGLPTGERASRAVSTTLDYTMTLTVATLVMTGLFMAAGDFVSDRREEVARTELEVVGQRLADDVATADRLARAGGGADRVAINASAPRTVAGSSYSIEVADAGSSTWLNLTTTEPEVTVRVRVQTQTDVAESTVHASSVSVVYDPGSDRLEVRS